MSLKRQKATEEKNGRAAGEKEGRGGWRGWEAVLQNGISDSPALSLLSILGVGEKASHLLYYYQALIRTALTHLSTKAS